MRGEAPIVEPGPLPLVRPYRFGSVGRTIVFLGRPTGIRFGGALRSNPGRVFVSGQLNKSMKIVEITTAPMRTYWHVTPHTRLKSIMQDGIRPSRRRQWKNYLGARLGQTGMVYMFTNFDSAIQFGAKLEWSLKMEKRRVTQVDILEVQTNAPTENDMNVEAQLDGVGKWVMTPSAIPPSQIIKVIPLTLQMTRDFIARRDGRSPAGQENAPQPAPTRPESPDYQGQP